MRIDSSPSSALRSPSGLYAAPLAEEPLRRGHSGPRVLELQQQLNALGASPPLVLDGKLGPKTEAAMKALLAAPPAPSTDAFEPAAPAVASPVTSPEVAGATAVTASSEASPVAGRVVDQAFAENDSINPLKRGDDGRVKGWQQLQTVFEKTTGWRPSDAECQTVKPGSGLKPGGKSWCGIWACHIYQQAGVDCRWDLTKGKMVGDVTQTLAPRFTSPGQYKAERQAFEQSIRPGDVITLNGATNHHAIVTQVNPDGTVETMDGNKPHVGPGRAKLADVTSFYRPNGD